MSDQREYEEVLRNLESSLALCLERTGRLSNALNEYIAKAQERQEDNDRRFLEVSDLAAAIDRCHRRLNEFEADLVSLRERT